MNVFLPTLIFRHRKENLKKCTLKGLEERNDLCFLTYPTQTLPKLNGQIILSIDSPPLSFDDHDKGLVIIDGTWNYASKIERQITGRFIKRSIPKYFKTSYPRKQTGCIDPQRGLASIEALYIAYHIFGFETKGLLSHYYWKDLFLESNATYLQNTPNPDLFS